MTDELDISPRTLLQLAPNLRTRFDAVGHVLVDAPDGTIVDIGPRGYAILSLFAQPLALGDAIEQLEDGERSSTDFVPTLSVINMLIEDGALVRPDAGGGPSSGWADPVEHARMLHDDRRTGEYLAALAQAVRPGDVVLDIGTGSGVLAVAAARAGARHVYAVEASDIAEVAERVFAVNDMQDRITLLVGWSRQIDLPEPADLLVSEVIGNEPFEEEILETTLDARRRLLKPDARLIPNALTLFARPLLLPESEARQRALGRAAVERWRGLYGIDFEPLVDAAAPGPVNSPTEAEVAATWPPVGPPIVLAVLDLTAFDAATVRAAADLTLDAPGAVNAVAVTFCAELYGGIAHLLDPWAWPTSSWATSVWVLPDSLYVWPGAVLRVHYNRRVRGTRDGLTCEVVEAAAR
jgi:protein arginine N-methyltransferase 1